MFVPATVFTEDNDKEKETTKRTRKHHYHKEEVNISKMKMENSEVDYVNEIVQEENCDKRLS